MNPAATLRSRSGARILVDALRIHGVDMAFGVPGESYIDVLDAFYFTPVKRIYLRDPVVGALVVAPRAPGDPANVNLRLYGLTTTGVLGLAITNEDLVR